MASVKEVLKAEGGSIAEKLLIPPHLLDIVPDYNARTPGPELEAHIEWLAGQIKAKGFDQNQPVEVSRNGSRFNVRHGHCRTLAVLRLIENGEKILTIPALLEPSGTNDVDRAYRIGTQNGQLPLSDLDYGILVKRLRGYGQSDEQIWAGFGKSKTWLSRILELAGASHDVHQAVLDKTISPTVAVQTVRRHGDDAGAVIARAKDHARSEGRRSAKPRDIAAVTEKPRTEPESVCSLAVAAVAAWRSGDGLDEAMARLEARLGPLLAKAA